MGSERAAGVWVGIALKVGAGACVGMGSCVEVGLGEGAWVAVGELGRGVGELDNCDDEEGIDGWQATHIPRKTIPKYR